MNIDKQEWFQRLLSERVETACRLNDLNNYVMSDSFSRLSKEAKLLLTLQVNSMKNYLLILDSRVELIREENA